MAHLTYEESKKRVVYGLLLLGAVTLVEVFISLLGKGHIIPGKIIGNDRAFTHRAFDMGNHRILSRRKLLERPPRANKREK